MEREFVKYFSISKIDEQAHSVYGLATSEAVDSDGEIADYGGCKDAFMLWSNDFLQRTTAAGQEPSLGNIRVQHQLEVGGKVSKIDYKDAEKQIWLEAVPVSEDIWQMLKGGFYTGFSIGGRIVKSKKEGEHVRYWPSISEVSIVDNPANPEATFAYVRANGSIELRKFTPRPEQVIDQVGQRAKEHAKGFSSVLTANDLWEGSSNKGEKSVSTPLNPLFSPEQLAVINSVVLKASGKTKRVAGEDLSSSAFAYVGDSDDPSTWKLPIHFSSEDKSKRHVRNALARFGQTQGIPAEEKEKVHAKIVAAAKKYGIEVDGEEKKAQARFSLLKTALTEAFETSSLKKSLFHVGVLAEMLQTVSWLYVDNLFEADYENDDRDEALAVELRAVGEHLIEILEDTVAEEADELFERKRAALRAAKKGANDMADTQTPPAPENLDKGKKNPLESQFGKGAAHHETKAEHHSDHAEEHDGMAESCKAAMDHCKNGMEACKAMVVKADGEGGMSKLMECFKGLHEHFRDAHKMHKAKGSLHRKAHKAHASYAEVHKSTMASIGGEHEGGLPPGDKAVVAETVKTETVKAAPAAVATPAATAAVPATPATVAAPVVEKTAADAITVALSAFQKGMEAMQKSVTDLTASVTEIQKNAKPADPAAITPGVEPRTEKTAEHREVPRATKPNGAIRKSASTDDMGF